MAFTVFSNNKFVKLIKNDSKEKKIQEIYQVFKPFLIICQILGTAPLTFNLSERILYIIPLKLTKLQIFLQICHYIWCLMLTGSVLTAIHYQRTLFDTSLPFLTRTIYTIEYTAVASSYLFIIFGSQCLKGLYPVVLERLADIELVLSKLGLETDFKKFKRILWLVIAGYVLFFVLVLLVDFYYNEKVMKDFFRSATTYSLPNFTWVLALTQFCSMMVIIHDKLKKINYLLVLLTKNSYDKTRNPVLYKFFTQ